MHQLSRTLTQLLNSSLKPIGNKNYLKLKELKKPKTHSLNNKQLSKWSILLLKLMVSTMHNNQMSQRCCNNSLSSSNLLSNRLWTQHNKSLKTWKSVSWQLCWPQTLTCQFQQRKGNKSTLTVLSSFCCKLCSNNSRRKPLDLTTSKFKLYLCPWPLITTMFSLSNKLRIWLRQICRTYWPNRPLRPTWVKPWTSTKQLKTWVCSPNIKWLWQEMLPMTILLHHLLNPTTTTTIESKCFMFKKIY